MRETVVYDSWNVSESFEKRPKPNEWIEAYIMSDAYMITTDCLTTQEAVMDFWDWRRKIDDINWLVKISGIHNYKFNKTEK